MVNQLGFWMLQDFMMEKYGKWRWEAILFWRISDQWPQPDQSLGRVLRRVSLVTFARLKPVVSSECGWVKTNYSTIFGGINIHSSANVGYLGYQGFHHQVSKKVSTSLCFAAKKLALDAHVLAPSGDDLPEISHLFTTDGNDLLMVILCFSSHGAVILCPRPVRFDGSWTILQCLGSKC